MFHGKESQFTKKLGMSYPETNFCFMPCIQNAVLKLYCIHFIVVFVDRIKCNVILKNYT